MTSKDEKLKELEKIFFSYSEERKKELLEQEFKSSNKLGRLAHYTTAENALKIIKSKMLWLRNTKSMDDFSEVSHGQQVISNYLKTENWANRDRLKQVLAKCGASIDELNNFDSLWQTISHDTYISCFTEHKSKDDDYGRLSMWRAFGKNTAAVAIIFKYPPEEFTKASVILSPVLYCQARFTLEFDQLIQRIEDKQQYISENLKPNAIIQWVYWALVMAAVSLKHSSFEEEREWRLLYLASHFENSQNKLESNIEIIGGIPQLVYKFKFEDISGKSLNDIVERVIIGPSQYADVIFKSLIAEMDAAGITDSKKKIFFSNIPLR